MLPGTAAVDLERMNRELARNPGKEDNLQEEKDSAMLYCRSEPGAGKFWLLQYKRETAEQNLIHERN